MIIKILDDTGKSIVEHSYCNVSKRMGNSIINLLDSVVNLGNNLGTSISIYNKEDNEESRNNHE